MKLYFAGEWWNNYFNVPQNVLWSYAYIKDFSIYKGRKSFLLDSGAFSANTLWKKINIDDYIKFIKEHKEDITTYACLDVIGDAEWTLKNQKYMEACWLNPMPTFHLWSDIKNFEYLVNNYDYIGLGWTVPYAKDQQKLRRFFDYCFSYVFKHKLKTKFHWWWMTNYKLMVRYPFYTVDSTWWLSWVRFNRFQIYSKWNLIGYTAEEYRKKFKIDFWKLTRWDKLRICYDSYIKLEEYCTKLHQAKGMEYRL